MMNFKGILSIGLLITIVFACGEDESAIDGPLEQVEKAESNDANQDSFLKTVKIEFLIVDSVSENYKIGYTEYDEEFKLYYFPHIISSTDTMKIPDFNAGCDRAYDLSPDGEYMMVGELDIGWVGEGEDKFLHDRYGCMIIDLKAAKIMNYMDGDCAGQWNELNQWIVEPDAEVIWPEK
ncbi:MAG: hypothetical protein ACI857_003239 [Arenicella sp.]|jgi:hypothetical protein